MLTWMKFPASFRARLIWTIFPVVAGIALAVLVLAEWKFTATYQSLFEAQFESQIAAVTEAKTRRFEALSSVLERLAQNPALLAAVRRGDYPGATQELRPALEALATSRLQSEFGGPSKNGPQPDRRDERGRGPFGPPRPPLAAGNAPFIALLDKDGNFIGQRNRQNNPLAEAAETPGDAEIEVRRRSPRMPWLGARDFESVLARQEAGYLIVEAGGKPQVREVFVTPMRDEENGDFLGAFTLGLPLPAVAERTLFEQSRREGNGHIVSGVYVEGRLVSSILPEHLRSEVEKTLEEVLKAAREESRDLILPIEGKPHRLIHRELNPDSPFPRAVQVSFYPLAALNAEIRDLRKSTAGLALVALWVSLGVVMLVSRGLSGPVGRLVAAVQEIEQGNYEVRARVTPDEMGRLARALNDMAAGLALQEKYRSVLNSVADRTVAERLIENREALSGELRSVSVLFCDIRGFTALSEKMPPQELIGLLNAHMTALTRLAYDHGGIVDKFVGDLIMVLFGAPVSAGDDARHAVECARAMLAERRRLNETGAGRPLEVGIGIATGDVVAGCMGSEQRLSYTVLGHRVNLASRLCSVAGPGEIMTDAETVSALHGTVLAEAMPPMKLKGLSEPVQVFRIS